MMLLFNPFFTTALLAGIFASIAAGIIGSFLVVRRMVFIGGSISHALLGGVGIFLFARELTGSSYFNPQLGALLFSLISAGTIGSLSMQKVEREDSAIGALWTLGMGVGILFASWTPGYNAEILHYLFGNILWATKNDLFLLVLLDLVLALIVYFFRYPLLAICFHEELAQIQKVKVKPLHFLLLGMSAVTIVLLIQILGSILIIAFLSIPAAIASRYTSNLFSMIYLSIAISILCTLLGTGFALLFDSPLGASISAISALFYFILLPFKK